MKPLLLLPQSANPKPVPKPVPKINIMNLVKEEMSKLHNFIDPKYPNALTIKDQVEQHIEENKSKSNFDYNPDFNIPNFDFSIEKNPSWREENKYVVWVNPYNGRITTMIGLSIDIDYIHDTGVGVPIRLGKISQELYSIIHKSINSNEMMTFWDPDEEKITLRRLMLELDLTTTTVDNDLGLISIDNVIRFRPRCIDENFNIVSNIEQLQIKSMRSRITKEVSSSEIMGQVGSRRATVKNDQFVTIKLVSEGRHIFRIKCFVPGISNVWLTLYPECMKLCNEDLESLKNRISNLPKPSQMSRI